jgi:hypothetical protein
VGTSVASTLGFVVGILSTVLVSSSTTRNCGGSGTDYMLMTGWDRISSSTSFNKLFLCLGAEEYVSYSAAVP